MNKFTKCLLFLILCVMCNVSLLVAQNKISGTVVEESGEPLIGVQVIPVGAVQSGGLTDINGKFSISVPSGVKQLSFTYVGYQTQTIDILSNKVINVTMKEDSKQLETVVVTAMGIKRKSKSLTYATQSISNKDLTRVQDANFVNALQGKTAGLTITPNSGGAGSASKILLRGNASIQGNNSPLIVVDGVPMNNSIKNTNGYSIGYSKVAEGSDPLSSINPEDISDVNILKGANAAALYGSDAANGVIIITTKSGREGSLKVDFSTNMQMETPMILPKFQSSYGASLSGNGVNADSWGEKISANEKYHLMNEPYNLKKFFKVGYTMNNSVAVSGGTKMVQSYFSINNTTASGMMPGNKFQRNGITLKESFNFFDDRLKIDVSGNYVYQTNTNAISGGVVYNPLYNLYMAPRNLDIDYYKSEFEKKGEWESNPITIYPEWDGSKLTAFLQPKQETNTLNGMQQNWFKGRGVPGANNPYWLINRLPSSDITQRMYATFSLNYKINKIFDIVYRANIDRNQSSNESKTYATTVDPAGVYVDRGMYGWGKDHSTNFYTDALFNYHQTIFNDWSLSGSIGGSFKRSTGEHFWMRNVGAFDRDRYVDKKNLPTAINQFYPTASYATTREFSLPSDWARSVFVTAQIGWKEKAYIDASYRIDWSRAFSQFSDKVNPFYGYYSVGANVLLNELINMPKWINLIKFRSSVSEVGNSIPNFNFDALATSTSGAIKAKQYASFDNPKPETVLSFEGGFDFAAFNNRLNFDFTYYNSTMFNQFLPITGSSGTLLPINSGKIRNQGVEVTLSYNQDITKDFYWRTSFNYAFNNNKIINTYQGRSDISVTIGASGELRAIFREGGAYGDLYAKDFARYNSFDQLFGRTQNGRLVKEGDIRLNAEGAPSLDNVKGYTEYLGNINAKHTFGWSNNFSYKDFDFYFLLDGKIGGKVVSFTEAYLDAVGNSQRSGDARSSGETIRWQFADAKDPNILIERDVPAVRMPDGNYAPAEAYFKTIGSNIFASQYVYDATNIRLREMSVGYTFRNIMGNGKNINLSLTAHNLFFVYLKAPVDPDVSLSTGNALGGVDVFNMPTARSLGMSIKFSF